MSKQYALYPIEQQAQVLEERYNLPASLKTIAVFNNAENRIRNSRLPAHTRQAMLNQLAIKKKRVKNIFDDGGQRAYYVKRRGGVVKGPPRPVVEDMAVDDDDDDDDGYEDVTPPGKRAKLSKKKKYTFKKKPIKKTKKKPLKKRLPTPDSTPSISDDEMPQLIDYGVDDDEMEYETPPKKAVTRSESSKFGVVKDWISSPWKKK